MAKHDEPTRFSACHERSEIPPGTVVMSSKKANPWCRPKLGSNWRRVTPKGVRGPTKKRRWRSTYVAGSWELYGDCPEKRPAR